MFLLDKLHKWCKLYNVSFTEYPRIYFDCGRQARLHNPCLTIFLNEKPITAKQNVAIEYDAHLAIMLKRFLGIKRQGDLWHYATLYSFCKKSKNDWLLRLSIFYLAYKDKKDKSIKA